MLMTKFVLEKMVSKKKGAIVNTSSAAGTQISPLLAGYAGVKGGVVAFSKSLAAELKPKGIDVQVQTPLFVTTKLAKIKRSSWSVPSPETYAKAAVGAIGYDTEISPYWPHALQLYLMDRTFFCASFLSLSFRSPELPGHRHRLKHAPRHTQKGHEERNGQTKQQQLEESPMKYYSLTLTSPLFISFSRSIILLSILGLASCCCCVTSFSFLLQASSPQKITSYLSSSFWGNNFIYRL